MITKLYGTSKDNKTFKYIVYHLIYINIYILKVIIDIDWYIVVKVRQNLRLPGKTGPLAGELTVDWQNTNDM